AHEGTHVAAVIDPQRDSDQYVSFAAAHGCRIAHVFLTHFHADFVAGHLELRDRTGATIYLGAAARAEYAFTPLHDNDVVELGRVRLKAIETPGHTAESISILVFDLDRSSTEPHAVLTGDTLFVGDVGRPDLRVALGWSAADLGGLLYDSLRTKLLTLPDASLVYPAHGAGSLCGKALSSETVSTIGASRQLRAATDDQAGVRGARHGRSAGRPCLLYLRCRLEQPREADTRSRARTGVETPPPRDLPLHGPDRGSSRRHPRPGGVCAGALCEQPQQRVGRTIR